MNTDQEIKTLDHDITIGILPRSRDMNLAAKESESMGIGIEIPKNAPSGTYSFNVDVVYDDHDDRLGTYEHPYTPTRKIYVKVP